MGKYKLNEFRSGGFVNKKCDMGRVYIDLPLIEAKKLLNKLNKPRCKDGDEYPPCLECGKTDLRLDFDVGWFCVSCDSGPYIVDVDSLIKK